MRTVAILLLLSAALAAWAAPASIPKEYWKSLVTVDEVEDADRAWRGELVARYNSLDYVLINGDKVAVNAEMRAKFAASITASPITANPDWRKIKELHRPGDQIYKFMWPPLSGPIGYVLVRDGQE